MKNQAHRRGRTWIVAGEETSLAELALALACGTALAVGGWAFVVVMVAVLAPYVP